MLGRCGKLLRGREIHPILPDKGAGWTVGLLTSVSDILLAQRWHGPTWKLGSLAFPPPRNALPPHLESMQCQWPMLLPLSFLHCRLQWGWHWPGADKRPFWGLTAGSEGVLRHLHNRVTGITDVPPATSLIGLDSHKPRWTRNYTCSVWVLFLLCVSKYCMYFLCIVLHKKGNNSNVLLNPYVVCI